MGVFYILVLVPLAIQHFRINRYSIDYQKKNTNALFIFFVLMTLLVALRHESVGNDTRNYLSYFEVFSKLSWAQCGSAAMEWGFVYYNKIISLFTEDPQVFFAITGILAFAMIYPTYKRLCVDASLTIMLYVIMSTFVMAFSGIRQMIAIGIGVIAYEKFVRGKKIIPFVVSVILAMTFHLSAIMLIFMYPLYHARITKKWLLFVIPVLGFIFAFNKQIFASLVLILQRFTAFEGEISSTGAYTMLILFAMFAVFAFLIPDEDAIDNEIIGLRNFLLFSVVLQMFAPLHTLAMRLNYYYMIFIPLLLPKIIEHRSDKYGQVAIAARHIVVGFFLLYFFFSAYTSESNLHVFPYHFFWETL